ncbi:hypothetical protein Ancab_008206 [Ancistrocladus abbreviatus]
MSPVICVSLHLLFFSLFNYQVTCSFSFNTSSHLCHTLESSALLQFKNGLQNSFDTTINPFFYCASYNSYYMYHNVCREELHATKKINSWKKGTDCCMWDGVQCDPSTGHVVPNLLGNLPTEIMNLPHLHALDLGENANLSADFTQSNWSSPLEELHFDSCNFTGRLPHSIGQSNSMRIVDIIGNSFTGFIPQWIWNTTESIALGFNYFTGELPSSVNESMLSNLQVILLHDNMLNGSIPSWLFALPSIVRLALNVNQFTGQISAEILSNSLREIDLSYNNLGSTVDLDMFSKLKNLRLLSLSRNNL